MTTGCDLKYNNLDPPPPPPLGLGLTFHKHLHGWLLNEIILLYITYLSLLEIWREMEKMRGFYMELDWLLSSDKQVSD